MDKKINRIINSLGKLKYVIIGLFLYYITNMVYWHFCKDWDNPYWNLVYNIPDYILKLFLLFFVLSKMPESIRMNSKRTARTKTGFVILSIVYFFVIMIAHLICFIDIELYDSLIGYVGYWGMGAWLLVSGLLVLNLYVRIDRIINFIKAKSHGCTKI